jgi:hypothetical protein
MFGRQRHNVAVDIKALTTGPTCDLLQLTGGQQPGCLTVVFAQLGQHHGPQRDVDANAQGIGATQQFQQALL